jgi:hypothetical protein
LSQDSTGITLSAISSASIIRLSSGGTPGEITTLRLTDDNNSNLTNNGGDTTLNSSKNIVVNSGNTGSNGVITFNIGTGNANNNFKVMFGSTSILVLDNVHGLQLPSLVHGSTAPTKGFLGANGSQNQVVYRTTDEMILDMNLIQWLNDNYWFISTPFKGAFSSLNKSSNQQPDYDTSQPFFTNGTWDTINNQWCVCTSITPTSSQLVSGLSGFFDITFQINDYGTNANGLGVNLHSIEKNNTIDVNLYFKSDRLTYGGNDFLYPVATPFVYRVTHWMDQNLNDNITVFCGVYDSGSRILWSYLTNISSPNSTSRNFSMSIINSLNAQFFLPFIDCPAMIVPTTAKALKVIGLTDGATIDINAQQGNIFKVTIAGNRTIANPTNPNNGQMLMIRVKQDATGSRLLSWSSKYRFGSDLPAPTLSTGANKTDYLGFVYNESSDTWDYVSEVKGL